MLKKVHRFMESKKLQKGIIFLWLDDGNEYEISSEFEFLALELQCLNFDAKIYLPFLKMSSSILLKLLLMALASHTYT